MNAPWSWEAFGWCVSMLGLCVLVACHMVRDTP